MNTSSGIVLAFDDGRSDNYSIWKEVLEPLGIPATFNITTAYNDGTEDARYSPTALSPMGPDRIAELAESPLVEIGCHGKEHVCNAQDAREGEQILRRWISKPDDEAIGYACPNSELDILALKGKEWERYLYKRTGAKIRNHEIFRAFIRKVNRILHIPQLYRMSFAGCIMHECEDGILYSATVLQDTKVEEIMSLVDLAVREEGHLILLFHSVGDIPGPEGLWSYSDQKFRALCDQLLAMQKDNKIKMMTTAQLYGLLRK